MNNRRIWAALFVTLLINGLAQAQEFRGRVQGVVTDPGGGVVPGASTVLRNDQTGVANTRLTNSEGRYFFDYVDPGTYTLTVELTGFKTAVQKNIVVGQRGDVTVDMRIEIGNLTETVTVSESPVAVQFNTASHDLTLDKQMVVDLPSATRNPWQLALLDPTVVNCGNLVETQPYHNRTANCHLGHSRLPPTRFLCCRVFRRRSLPIPTHRA